MKTKIKNSLVGDFAIRFTTNNTQHRGWSCSVWGTGTVKESWVWGNCVACYGKDGKLLVRSK